MCVFPTQSDDPTVVQFSFCCCCFCFSFAPIYSFTQASPHIRCSKRFSFLTVVGRNLTALFDRIATTSPHRVRCTWPTGYKPKRSRYKCWHPPGGDEAPYRMWTLQVRFNAHLSARPSTHPSVRPTVSPSQIYGICISMWLCTHLGV